jgi:hypothetical protein
MSSGEVALLIALGVAAAAALCWFAVKVAVHRVREEGTRDGRHRRPGRV